jgi:hypothetical protein
MAGKRGSLYNLYRLLEVTAMVQEVSLTTARNLSPFFDEAVRRGRPVMIVRGGRERGLLVSREAMLRMLSAYRLHVNVLPEDGGGFTLWLRELNIAGSGPTLAEARADLLSAVQSYVKDYHQEFDFYRHLPDLVAQEPYVILLSLAKDDAQLIEMLFGAETPDESPLASNSPVG